MKWVKYAKEGIIVAGGKSFVTIELSSMNDCG
jgi:hypothetical protein